MRAQPRQRVSRLARWSLRAAVAAVAILVGASFGHRSDIFSTGTTLGLVATGFVLALSAAVMAMAGIRGIWRDGRSGFRRAAMGLILAILTLAYPAGLIWRVTTLPALSDIATDLADPPRFTSVPGPVPTTAQEAEQRDAYPEVAARQYAATAAEVFAAVLALVEDREWAVVRAVEPVAAQGEGDDRLVPDAGVGAGDADPELPPAVEDAVARTAIDGEVEAVARTGFIGFEEDVVVRIRADDTRTTVDMRSASRTFDHDFGSNARRIREFLDDLDAAVGG